MQNAVFFLSGVSNRSTAAHGKPLGDANPSPRQLMAANSNLKSAHVEMTGGSFTRLYYVENCDQRLLF